MAWKNQPVEVVLPTRPDDYADIHQVAHALHVSRATVYREIKHGRFPGAIKIRGRSMWRWGWVLDYKRRLEEESRPQTTTPGRSGGWEG